VSARVVVIGAGIAGLATAFDLITHDPDLDVLVLEASPSPGGKMRTTPFAGLRVDEAADAFLARVPWAVNLCEELGLTDELVSPAEGSAYIWTGGALRRIPHTNLLGVPLDLDELAASGIVSGQAVAQLAADLEREHDDVTEALAASRGGDAAAAHDESIATMIGRRLGEEIDRKLVDPLIGGIYAGDTRSLSLYATAPQFAAAAERGPSLVAELRRTRAEAVATARPVFYGHRDGSGRIIEALARRLGGRLRLECSARAIRRIASGYAIDTQHGDTFEADAIVLAAPAFAAAPLLERVSSDASRACGSIDYAGVALAAIAVPKASLSRPLDASGFLVPKTEGRFVTACSWASTKWAHLGTTDHAILRVSSGHVGDHRALAMSDDDIVSSMLADLRDMMELACAPAQVRVTRWTDSFPQYRPGHRALVASIAEALRADAPGVLVTGAAYGGIGIPACIDHARHAAESVRRHLG
jgi:oxygen-dependent protoporphyrinogen oxidase